MANIVLNIGTQTTNLLSNDNLIVYQDVSMKSKFNAASTSNAVIPAPLSADFIRPLATEYNICLSSNEKITNLKKLVIITNVDISSIELSSGNQTILLYDDDEKKFVKKPITRTALNVKTIEPKDNKFLLFYPGIDYVNARKLYVNKLGLSKWKIDKNVNVKAVQNSLHNIFTWIPGERILDPEFGSILYRYLYNGITNYNTEQIIAEIRKCISKYEPRVLLQQVKNISTIDDTENNTIHLELIYTIPTLTNEQYSYTYIYHKQNY